MTVRDKAGDGQHEDDPAALHAEEVELAAEHARVKRGETADDAEIDAEFTDGPYT